MHRLNAELEARKTGYERLLADWTTEEIDAFVTQLRRFNQSIEADRGKSWPREPADHS